MKLRDLNAGFKHLHSLFLRFGSMIAVSPLLYHDLRL